MALSAEALAHLENGTADIRGLIKFQFGTGTYGFIKALEPFTWGGLTYLPGGIIQVSDLSSGAGMTARQFEIALAASPDDELTPAVLMTIEQEDYRDRPVTIYDAHFDPNTGELIHVEAMKRGYVDVIDHREDEDGYQIIAMCESRALDYTRTNGRKRTTSDQARRAPGDLYFENAAKRGREEILWGRAKGT